MRISKNKICLLIFLIFTICGSAFAQREWEEVLDWDSSETEPKIVSEEGVDYYEITTPSEFAWFARNSGKNAPQAYLKNDIYMTHDSSLTRFNVPTIDTLYELDGRGHTVFGLKFKDSSFISIVEEGFGGLRNISFYNIGQTRSNDPDTCTYLIRDNYHKIETVSVTLVPNKNNNLRGALIYRNRGTINNFHFKVQKDIEDRLWGIIQQNYGLISNSSADIVYTDDMFGAGGYDDKLLWLAVNRGGGGIVAKNETSGIIDSCRSSVQVLDTLSIYRDIGRESLKLTFRGGAGALVYSNKGKVLNSVGEFVINTIEYYSNQRETSSKATRINMIYENSKDHSIGGLVAIDSGGTIENSTGKVYLTQFNPENARTATLSGLVGGAVGAVHSTAGSIKNVQGLLHIKTLKFVPPDENRTNDIAHIGGLIGHINGNKSTGSFSLTESFGKLQIDSIAFRRGYTRTSTMKNVPIYLAGLTNLYGNVSVENCHAMVDIKKREPRTNDKDNGGSGQNGSLYISSLIGSQQSPLGLTTFVRKSYGVYKDDINIEIDSVAAAGLFAIHDTIFNVSSVYYDKELLPDIFPLTYSQIKSEETFENYDVRGLTTAEMYSVQFVEDLNTDTGNEPNSGLWKQCPNNYPILVSEGACDEFYGKYAFAEREIESSSSAAEDISSSSAIDDASSSSSEVPAESSSSNSDDEEVSSSSAIDDAFSSSSEVPTESSSSNSNDEEVSSSSSDRDAFIASKVPQLQITVNGRSVTVFNSHGKVRIFDALGHLVASKTSLTNATTEFTLNESGRYLVQMNGVTKAVTIR